MPFRIQILCLECDLPMRYDANALVEEGICYWMCWACELTVKSTDFRHCLIDRSVPSDKPN